MPVQQSLEIRRYIKMMVHEVLWDRYKMSQEKFQYQGIENSNDVSGLYSLQQSLVIGNYVK